MRRSRRISHWVVSFWVALALLAAPWAPAFAAAESAPPPAGHAAHDSPTAGVVSHAHHAKVQQDAGSTGHQNTSCAQHEQCSGKCCAACAQCFTAATAVPVSFSTVLAVYSPTEPSLHDRLTVAPHDRPPAA